MPRSKSNPPHAECTEHPKAADRLRVEVDYNLYTAYLENTGFTETQRREFIQALKVILVGFVDLGFEVVPAADSCGQPAETTDKPPVCADNALYSDHHKIIKKYIDAAACETQGDGKGVEH